MPRPVSARVEKSAELGVRHRREINGVRLERDRPLQPPGLVQGWKMRRCLGFIQPALPDPEIHGHPKRGGGNRGHAGRQLAL